MDGLPCRAERTRPPCATRARARVRACPSPMRVMSQTTMASVGCAAGEGLTSRLPPRGAGRPSRRPAAHTWLLRVGQPRAGPGGGTGASMTSRDFSFLLRDFQVERSDEAIREPTLGSHAVASVNVGLRRVARWARNARNQLSPGSYATITCVGRVRETTGQQ